MGRSQELRALAEERERFRLLAENISDVVLQAHADGTITWVSPALTTVLGWRPDQVVGHRLIEIIHPDDLPAIVEAQGRIAHGETRDWEARVRTAGGGYRWLASRARPILDDSGVVTSQVVACRDVEDERVAREALQESEERYRLLAENASDIVYLTGPDRLIRWIAPSVERVLGWTPQELIGTAFYDLVNPGDMRIVDSDREEVYTTGSLQSSEARYTLQVRHKDGHYSWFSCIGTPVLSADGTPGGLIGGLKLVDDLVAERERVAHEAEQRQAILDSLLDPHVLLQAVRDESGVIVDFVYADANEAACEYNQTPRERLIGARLLDLLPGHAGTGMLAMYARAVESGQPLILNDYVYPHDVLGSDRRFDIRAVRVGDALSYTWRDVTERFATAQRIADSERLLRINMDAVQDPLVLLQAVRDPETGEVVDLRYLDVHEATCAYLSMPREELIGRGVLELAPGQRHAGLYALYVEAIDRATSIAVDDFRYDNEILKQTRYYDIRARGVTNDLVSLTWRDVTDRHDAAAKIAASEERFRLLAENSTAVVLQVRDGIMGWVSPALTAALGWKPDEWLERGLEEFAHPDDIAMIRQLRAEMIGTGTPNVITVRMRHSDGEYHWAEFHVGPFTNAQGQRAGIVASFRVVDAEVAAKDELEHLARFDVLTGVLNRTEILHKLSGISAGTRHPGEQTAILFCDVDHFKEINDSYGHAVGDEVLRTLAERIGAAVRDEDHVARFGGDELLVILTAIHGLDDALAVAEKILEAASDAIDREGTRVSATLSIGVTVMRTGETVDALIARADQAMYAAKSGGRNQVISIDSLS